MTAAEHDGEVALFLCDAEGVVRSVSGPFVRLTGFEAGAVAAGLLLHEPGPPDGGGLGVLLGPRGHRVAARLAPLDLRDGQRIGVVSVLTRAEADLARREELLAVAAHDTRNRLAVLAIQADLVAQSVGALVPEAGAQLAAHVYRMEQLAAMLGNLLEAMHEDVLRIVRVATNLGVLVGELVQRHAAHAARARSPISCALDESVWGFCDRDGVERALDNVLDNAIKYGRGTAIEVRLTATQGGCRITVQDGGRGIAPADHERIFARAVRVGEAPRVRGFGLGLWIVRRIVEAHGGRVWVESAPGAGATFVIDLPLELDTMPLLPSSPPR